MKGWVKGSWERTYMHAMFMWTHPAGVKIWEGVGRYWYAPTWAGSAYGSSRTLREAMRDGLRACT